MLINTSGSKTTGWFFAPFKANSKDKQFVKEPLQGALKMLGRKDNGAAVYTKYA